MQLAQMNLKILLPYKIFALEHHVLRIVAVTDEGAFGIYPNRLDCVAALSAGILVFQIKGADEAYIAVDEGVLVKTGFDVLVSVRNAVTGGSLSELHEAVEQQFLQLSEEQLQLRSVLAKMESSFSQALTAFHQNRGTL